MYINGYWDKFTAGSTLGLDLHPFQGGRRNVPIVGASCYRTPG